MNYHDKSLEIITLLNLDLNDIGKLIGVDWRMIQRKKSQINGNHFTKEDFEKLEQLKNKLK